MKKTMSVLFILFILLLLLNGCGSSDLEAYQKALLETASFTSGSSVSRLSIDLAFDETGMTFEERRDTSYYERIQVETDVMYNDRDGNKAVVDSYYNFGGIGFDMMYYINGDEMLIKLPILDKFLDIKGQMISDDSDGGENAQEGAMKKIIDTWNSVLNDEDVFSGSKAYVMTDKGQIKTTTYTININEQQYEVLKEALLKILDDDNIVEALLASSDQFMDVEVDKEALVSNIKEMIKTIQLVEFSGEAYVDFDGRLVKQVLSCDLMNEQTEPGGLKTMHINYETGYDQLGDDLKIVIPEVKDEDILHVDEDGNIQDYFPEGLF